MNSMITENGVNNQEVFILIILLEQGQVMPYFGALDMTILEIGIGVVILVMIGTTNHLVIMLMGHSVISLLASLALDKLFFK